MIHKAYMPVYSDPDFSCGTDGTDGTGRTDQPKVVQEVLADLKTRLEGGYNYKLGRSQRLIFSDSNGDQIDFLGKVLIFRESHGAQTVLLEKNLIFRYHMGPKLTFLRM